MLKDKLQRIPEKIAGIPLWILVLGFISLVMLPIINTALFSVARGWFYPHLLPPQYTLLWFRRTLTIWALHETFLNTAIIAVSVMVTSILIAFPAAYILARGKIPWKSLITVVLLIPVILPPLTYGIPVAKTIFEIGLNNTFLGIIAIQLLPILPFVILMLRGVITSVPISLEEQAASLGANKFQVFRRVVFPMIRPGVVAAAAWAIARSVSEFPLTFLVSGPGTTPMSVVLFGAFGATGVLPADNAALTMWLFVPAALFMGLVMRFLKAETITLKG